eukprot:TRINITY_DN272_c1_g1_i1.p1 TRINITY_DN272_c1_g1~~TRINITY_DN272_c1_g1_i1.p1  ORF type:complete len:445 (-),score=145.90 TRINITY_DN272_c1_g1_i1:44-1378(-)
MEPLMTWTSLMVLRNRPSNEDFVATLNQVGFPRMIRQRTVFGDEGIKYFKSIIVPYYHRVTEEADSIQLETLEGKKQICNIIDSLTVSYLNSMDRFPLCMRQSVSPLHPVMGRGPGPLDLCLGMMMMINLPFIQNPWLLGFLEEVPSGKVAQVLEECAKVWYFMILQIPQEEEPYKSIITAYNDVLNDFVREFYDETSIAKVIEREQIEANRDANREQACIQKLTEFLEGLELEGTTVPTLDRFTIEEEEEMTEDDRKLLLNKLEKEEWKLIKKEEGISYYEFAGERGTICARVDTRIKADMEDVTHAIQRLMFESNSRDILNSQSLTISDYCMQRSFVQKFPFPFSNRFFSYRSWIMSGATDSICYFSDHPFVASQGTVSGTFLPSGAYVRSTTHPSFVDVSFVLHYDPKGSVPRWVNKKLRKSMQKRMAQLLKDEDHSQRTP